MLKILSRYLVSLRKHLNVTKAWYFHKLAPASYYHSEGDIKDLNTDNASDVCVEPSSKIIEVWIFENSKLIIWD